jgi:hypothetical protein
MPTKSRGTMRRTVFAIACAGPLWGFAGVAATHAGCLTADAGSAKVTILRGIEDDAPLAAPAWAGGGLASGLTYRQGYEQSAYWDGYVAALSGRPPRPPLAPAAAPPVPIPAARPMALPMAPPPPPPPPPP